MTQQLNNKCFIGVLLLYDVVLVSTVQRSVSGIHMSCSRLGFPPNPQAHPTPLGYHRAPVELPVLHSNFPLAVYFTYGNAYVSMLLSPFVPPSPARVHEPVLYVCVSIPLPQTCSSVQFL